MATLEFVFDFASPNAYLCWRVLPALLARAGATLAVRPALLGGIFKATGNAAPMVAYAGAPAKLAYEALELRRFVEAHGLREYRMNPHFPLNSLAMMRGLVALQRHGEAAAHAYIQAVLSGMWERGLKMDDPAVLSATLDEAGLDGAAVLHAAASPEAKAALVAATEAEVARGVFGIPTFFVGDQMFFGKERLGQVEAALRAA